MNLARVEQFAIVKFHHFTNLLGGRDVLWSLNTGKESNKAILIDDLREL